MDIYSSSSISTVSVNTHRSKWTVRASYTCLRSAKCYSFFDNDDLITVVLPSTRSPAVSHEEKTTNAAGSALWEQTYGVLTPPCANIKSVGPHLARSFKPRKLTFSVTNNQTHVDENATYLKIAPRVEKA